MNRLLLASQSPRRRELIQYLDRPFDTCSVEVPEPVAVGETPVQVVTALAFEKAYTAAMQHDHDYVVIGSDTVVALDDIIFGKPASIEEAKSMIRQLSGRSHQVFTGLAVIHLATQKKVVAHSVSTVWFRELTEELIDWYVETGEPMDKAGAYAIQGYGARLIDRLEGDFFTVMGMSVAQLDKILTQYAL